MFCDPACDAFTNGQFQLRLKFLLKAVGRPDPQLAIFQQADNAALRGDQARHLFRDLSQELPRIKERRNSPGEVKENGHFQDLAFSSIIELCIPHHGTDRQGNDPEGADLIVGEKMFFPVHDNEQANAAVIARYGHYQSALMGIINVVPGTEFLRRPEIERLF